MLENTPKGQSKRAHKMKKNKTKTQHNMCWTPLYTSKLKSHGTRNVKTHNRTNKKKLKR